MPTPKMGAPTYNSGHFNPDNCMKLKRIGPKGGGDVGVNITPMFVKVLGHL